MAATSPLVQALTAELAKYPSIDPRAALAIATHEGLSGGIGDGGHAFGPFQENDAGGVLTGKFPGLTAAQKNAWAWTPAGIDSALNSIAKVAGGLKGAQAIQAIATRFERPANPGAEIADAEHHYGLPVQGGSSAQTLSAMLPAMTGGAGPGTAPPVAPHAPSPVLAALRYLGFNPGTL